MWPGRFLFWWLPRGTQVFVPPTTAAPVALSQEIVSTPQAMADTYGFGETIRIRVTWDLPVFVTGTPQFPADFGQSPSGSPEWFDYDRGSGTTEIDFTWVVAATDQDTNGLFLYDGNHGSTSDMRLNTGMMRSSGGTAADLALPTMGDTGMVADAKVDGTLMPSMADMFLWGTDEFLWGTDRFQWGT